MPDQVFATEKELADYMRSVLLVAPGRYLGIRYWTTAESKKEWKWIVIDTRER